MVLKNVCFVFSIKPQVSSGICPAKTIKQETLAPYLAAEIPKSGLLICAIRVNYLQL
jgi:hypothetical protein